MNINNQLKKLINKTKRTLKRKRKSQSKTKINIPIEKAKSEIKIKNQKSKQTSKKSKAKKPRLTPMQQAFKKEQRRIRNFVNAIKKRGYTVDRDWLNNLIQTPNRVTARQLENIRSIRPENIYAHSTRNVNGETLTGTRARNIERQAAARRGRITRAKNQLEKIITEALFREWRESGSNQEYETWLKNNPAIEQEIETHYKFILEDYIKDNAPGSFGTYVQEADVVEFIDKTKPDRKSTGDGIDWSDAIKNHEEKVERTANGVSLPKEADIVMDSFYEDLRKFESTIHNELALNHFHELVYSWIGECIQKYGVNAFAHALQLAGMAGVFFTYVDVYGDIKYFEAKCDEFLSFMGAPSEIQDPISEAAEDYWSDEY